MKNILSVILVLFTISAANGAENFALAENSDLQWELKKDREGIQVYTTKVGGSPYDAVLAKTKVTGTRLSSLVALLRDAEACADWADKCVESYVFKELDETEALVYTHNDLPFPVKDRDVLAHVFWQQDKDSLQVSMHSKATDGILAPVKGRLRLTEAESSWEFNPLPNGEIEILNQTHINPGSSLPGWVTNMLLVDTPFATIKAFVTAVKSEKYRDAQVSFVTEPE